MVTTPVPDLRGRDGRRAARPGDRRCRSRPRIGLERGGGFRIGESAATDADEANELVHGAAGGGGVVDVQTHFLEFGPWGQGFPQASCGEADWADCFSVEYWYDLVLGGSDTSVAVISAVPVVGEADPLSVAAMERGRELATRLCGDGRVLIQGHAVPDVGPIEAAVAAMADVAADHELCCLEGIHALAERLVPRRSRPGAAASRRAFIQAVRDTGVGVVAVHKGLAGGNPYASPVDIGPAAAANPDVTFLVYHSGFDTGTSEGPYDPDGAGVDRLVRSVDGGGGRAGRQRLRRARVDVAAPDGQSRRGRPRPRASCSWRSDPSESCGAPTRSGTARRRTRSPPSARSRSRCVSGAVRLSGVDPRGEAADHGGQRRRALRDHRA